MASSKRERELARMRAERQVARRTAAQTRRRQRQRTIAAVIAGIAVLALIGGITYSMRGEDKVADTLSSTPKGPTVDCTYTSVGEASKKIAGKPSTKAPTSPTPVVALATNQGAIELTLNSAKAPCTSNSFTFLTAQKYFDGTPCHRLTTKGIFVLQCGDPSGSGSGGPGYNFPDENLKGATYPKGTLAMANAGAGTNGSQFFLVYQDTQLPPDYTPFGTITKGLDVIDKIAKAGSTPDGDGKPKLAVKIETASRQS